MATLGFRKLSHQLTVWFLAIALTPLLVGMYLTYRTGERALREQVTSALLAIAARQSREIGDYIDENYNQINALDHTPTIERAFNVYIAAYARGLDSTEYRQAEAEYQPLMREIQRGFGVKDIYLISPTGSVLFSIEKQKDLGTNLKTGPYRDTALGAVFDRTNTLLEAEFSNYAIYSVTGEPSAFIASPVIRQDALVGVVVALLDATAIRRILDDHTGLGATGETALLELRGQEARVIMPLRRDPDAAFKRTVPIGSPLGLAYQRAVRGYRGSGTVLDYRGEEVLAAWRYVPALSNGLVVQIDTHEAFASTRRLELTALVLALAAGVIVIFAGFSVAQGISRPLAKLTATTTRIAQGDFQAKVEVRARNEIGQLADSFNSMTARLAASIAQLTETTRAKERVESELNIAHNIQMSYLQTFFPAFPDRKEFDLYAALEPAKEVGGDLYDFMLINDDELYFSVGDVSDKGVPAALLMLVSQTLMRTAAQLPAPDPAQMLVKVNADLHAKNEELMFVTMFCGILRLSTGELRYSNAGHNPPIILRGNDHAEWLSLPTGLVLGVMPNVPYKTFTTTLAPGDMLVVYTDGVTEAKSVDSKLYSDEKLLAFADANRHVTAADMVTSVMRSVKEHAKAAPQSDDITVLALSFAGPATAGLSPNDDR